MLRDGLEMMKSLRSSGAAHKYVSVQYCRLIASEVVYGNVDIILKPALWVLFGAFQFLPSLYFPLSRSLTSIGELPILSGVSQY